MRPKSILLPALAAGLLSLTGCEFDLGGSERFTSDFHYSYPLSPAGKISVETFNGGIEVSGWDENSIDISGTKHGPTQQDADALQVKIDRTPDSVVVRVVPPFDERSHRGASLVIKVPRKALLDRLIASNGSIDTIDGVGPAHFRTSNARIRVHELQGTLDATTSNGSLELLGIGGDVVAHTSNASVKAEQVRGSLDLSTSNGSINAEAARGDRPVRAATSNAGITLRLPSAANARITARTSNGSINSDFEMLRTQNETNRHYLEGTIGSGGNSIDLTTSNGGIRIVRM